MFVILWEPMRMRIPLAPARERAGGLISAGMISTVQTPFPILALTVPKVWPAFWAPSPESLTISTMCSRTCFGSCGEAASASPSSDKAPFASAFFLAIGSRFPVAVHQVSITVPVAEPSPTRRSTPRTVLGRPIAARMGMPLVSRPLPIERGGGVGIRTRKAIKQ
jgi:hypothetical protein